MTIFSGLIRRYGIFFILGAALALRVYRTPDFLGFWYDQGRDALVVWNLWHKGKLFLIGPTTGIEGIFLGPFYYYLIAPAYLLGGGNPVFPAVWLAVLNIAGIGVTYYLANTFFSRTTAIISVLFLAFSYRLALSHRWLSNPTPLPLFAALTVLALLKVIHNQPRWWWVLGLCAGLSLQLEAASAIFFLPAILLILIWKHIRPTLFGLALFGLTLAPQVIFDLRHQHLLVQSFQRFLVAEQSFQPRITRFIYERLLFYFHAFSDRFFTNTIIAVIAAGVVLLLALTAGRRLFRVPFISLLIWCLVPLVILLFYHGNHGYIWDYYFTGIYPVMAVIIACILARAWTAGNAPRIIAGLFMAVFLMHNLSRLGIYLTGRGPDWVNYSSELAAVDWVYSDSGGNDFNIDVYVPPVVPYAYDYLFLWQGTVKYSSLPLSSLTSRLYTLYEPDDQHPQFLSAWLRRQAAIGSVLDTRVFNTITVQRRNRM